MAGRYVEFCCQIGACPGGPRVGGEELWYGALFRGLLPNKHHESDGHAYLMEVPHSIHGPSPASKGMGGSYEPGL